MLERCNVEPSGHVFVCLHDIGEGDIVEAKDLQEKELDPAICPYTVVSDLSLIAGKRSTKELIPGKVIRANDLVWK
jgi:flagella basal body P-ring formation protein FlgA